MTCALFVSYTPSAQQLTTPKKGMENLAAEINKLNGLIAKTWLQNTSEDRRGGFYLFEQREDALAWQKVLLEQRTAEGATDFSFQLFDVLEDMSAMTSRQS